MRKVFLDPYLGAFNFALALGGLIDGNSCVSTPVLH